MSSIQYKMVNALFRMLRVNKMLDKEGPAFDKLLKTYREKQKKPLAVPYKKMHGYDILTKTVNQTTVYVVRKIGTLPGKAVLYGHVHDTHDEKLVNEFIRITRSTVVTSRNKLEGHPIPCNMINYNFPNQ